MPESILDGFVVLASSQLDGARIRLRFVPNYFEVQDGRAVVCVEVNLGADSDDASRKIAAIENDIVVGINADAQTLEIRLADEDQSIVFQGSVTWSYEDYIVSDYVRVVEDVDRRVRALQKQVSQLRGTIDRVAGFIDRAIDRTERKEGEIKPDDDRYAKEAQLLRSIRRQFSDN